MADFSVDLVTLSRAHVAFLRRAHAAGVSLQRPSAESVRRYRELWLPLLAARGGAAELALAEDLVPPLDIAWLWHTHRLAPRGGGVTMRREKYRKVPTTRSRLGENDDVG